MAIKEIRELVRQPQLLLLLLVGPILIMTTFGLSLDVENLLRPRALIVVEPKSEGARLFERFRDEFTDREARHCRIRTGAGSAGGRAT